MYDPPVILYRKGQPLKKKDCIAMVGSRITTPYGRKVAQNSEAPAEKHTA